MATLLKDIVSFLTTQGVIEGDGLDTFRDFIPEIPDSLVSISEYGGSPRVKYEALVNRSIQVSVRDRNASVARSKALDIYKAFLYNLAEDLSLYLTEDRFCQVYLRQTPFRLRTDATDRVIYGFNIGITTTIE